MTTLFPEKSRRDLLLKFKKEEREHPDEVDYALMHPLPVDSVDLQDSLLRMQSSDLAAEIAQSQLEDIPPSAQQTVLDHQEQLAELEEIFPNPDVGNRADEFSTR